MMNVFAREPVFTLKKEIFAYQFIYRNGLNGSFPLDLTNVNGHDEAQSGLNIDELMQVNMTIINLLPEALGEFGEIFSPNDVIIEVSEINNYPTSALLDQIASLKAQGFKLMANQHQLQWPEFMHHIDFLKLNIMDNTPTEIKNHKLRLANTKVKLIATNVHSQFQFDQCQSLDVDYLQGFFFLEKDKINTNPLPANKMAYMQLMTEIAKPALDIGALEGIFQKDPTLSFLLIKFINNPLVNKSHKISSIRHALSYLGEMMVRRFVAIISLAGLNSDKPSELLNLSLSRAKYCELLDEALKGKSEAMTAFLVGLFSLIDIILSKPMQELLVSLELDERITKALIENEGTYWTVLATTKSIESGDWGSLNDYSLELKIPKEQMFDLHRQSIRWQNEMTQAISPNFPVTQAAKTS
ncbi:MAG: EAL and modified HD-GYP domain-containing signal transduction protein [Alphaproteobacteria bacterium]|jgi:EAL and modified HD-GYP domain-containing signal transduction protein